MPQSNPPTVTPARSVNVVGANAGLAIKVGPGAFLGFTVNTAGTTSTLVVYDSLTATGTKLGTWSTTAQVNMTGLNLKTSTGLFIVTTGTLSDITVVYS